MKNIKGFTILICLSLNLLLNTQCRKKEEPEPEPVVNDESGKSGKDSRDAQSENDEANNDINQVMSENFKMSGKESGDPSARPTGVCGLNVDTAQASAGVLTLNYSGITCNNRTRTGTVVLTLQNYAAGTRWKDAGAVVKVDFVNYKIARASDQVSLQFNGTQYLTNVSGGNWISLLVTKTHTALVTTCTGTNLSVTWQDNKTAIYNINRRITYSLSGLVISLKAEGIGTSGNLTNLENFGTTRDGETFTSQVNTPIIWNTTCGAGAPLQGTIKITVSGKSTDLLFTYGVDSQGNTVAVSPNACAFGWKLEWNENSVVKSKVIGYK